MQAKKVSTETDWLEASLLLVVKTNLIILNVCKRQLKLSFNDIILLSKDSMEKKKEGSEKPSFGDHIFVQRSICYTHHGIYVGNNKVIHYETPMEDGYPDPKLCRVIESDIQTFLGDGTSWYLFRYAVKDKHTKLYPKGTFTSKECDEPKVVVQRARQALKDGFSHYNIVGNNCEDFANYCKTGQRSMESAQFSEALERVAVARRAVDNGYRSPLVYAGCIMGLFTLKDFHHQPANRIPCAEDTEKPRCTCLCDEEEETDEENDENTDEMGRETEKNTKINTYTNINDKNDIIDNAHLKSRDIGGNCTHQHNYENPLNTMNSSANGGHRKKVNFSIPENRVN